MIAGLILAAGESSRMGTDKALLIYRRRTFLETIIETLREAGVENVSVVLGQHAEEIQRSVNLQDARVIINRDYQRGQTSSLQAGLDALDCEELEAVVLCLVDHPAVSVGAVKKLLANFRQSGAPVVIPTYQGQRGHPVVIGRPLFSPLKELKAEEAGNAVIRQHRRVTQFVEVKDEGILLDVDDPETYRRLESR